MYLKIVDRNNIGYYKKIISIGLTATVHGKLLPPIWITEKIKNQKFKKIMNNLGSFTIIIHNLSGQITKL